MSERMTQALVMQALFGTVALRRPGHGLILHSDRATISRVIKQLGMNASMRRKADC
jgi:transposase InsO family protein